MSATNEAAENSRKKEEKKAAGTSPEQVAAQKPGAYESPYGGAMADLLGKLESREPFHYDPEKDPQYAAYRGEYLRQGSQAMEDTMGRAAGLTGGYGSSYSQSAGSAAYGGYVDRLNEMIPKLYAQALELYEKEGQQLLEQYGLISSLESQSYDRYSDSYDRWLREYGLAVDRYDSDRRLEYQQYLDSLAEQHRREDRERDQANWQAEMDLDWQRFLWQKEQDKLRGNGG